MFEMIVRETIEKALKGLDDIITAENAPDVLKNINSWENHKLLQEERAYVICKVDGRIKVMYCNGRSIDFDTEPVTLDLSKILDVVREKCDKALAAAEKSADSSTKAISGT